MFPKAAFDQKYRKKLYTFSICFKIVFIYSCDVMFLNKNKAVFLASLLQSSVAHDTSEIA